MASKYDGLTDDQIWPCNPWPMTREQRIAQRERYEARFCGWLSELYRTQTKPRPRMGDPDYLQGDNDRPAFEPDWSKDSEWGGNW